MPVLWRRTGGVGVGLLQALVYPLQQPAYGAQGKMSHLHMVSAAGVLMAIP
ncbi:MAG: hypothetical protein IT162_12290 [Bryobacterales bacterium]|nr:hypothetical protein [Bryobacterales bacterium]